jgi:hypothetical protein
MFRTLRLLLVPPFLLTIAPALAEVVRVEVQSTSDLGETGYEELVGTLHYEIDPRDPRNAIIADVALAPMNEAGRVSFSGDLRVLRPKDPSKQNGAAWIEIPNRGGKASLQEWFVRHGFTVVSVGWEFDILPEEEKMRLEVPEARNEDGTPIRGVVSAVFTPDKTLHEQKVTDLAIYPPVDPEGPDSRLLIRDRAAFPGGRKVPREDWSVEGHRVRLAGGFEPGLTYEVSWLAEGPPLAGLGYAAIRDAVAWLKHGDDSLAPVDLAYAFGSSQCGRFLRDFVYLGFNTDEHDRIALDGIMAHVAGAGRLILNERWSKPRAIAGYDTSSFPFADSALTDPVSGRTDGILDNPRVTHRPKIFYTNMAAEYWGAGRVAALTHTDVVGEKDLAFPDEVRSYFFAGTSHGPAPFPPTALLKGEPLANPVSASPSIYALRLAMHQWVSEGIEPPASVVPKHSDGSLVPVAAVNFPSVPGLASPHTVSAGGRVSNPQWPDGAGGGTELPLLVPRVDADGNDLPGIRMPDVAVPLGTATGWVFRPEAMGSPHEFYLLRGAWVPFAATRAGREAAGDPRPSVEERYGSKDDYLAKVRAVLGDLVDRRLLEEIDLEKLVRQAGERWDWVVGRRQ